MGRGGCLRAAVLGAPARAVVGLGARAAGVGRGGLVHLVLHVLAVLLPVPHGGLAWVVGGGWWVGLAVKMVGVAAVIR